MLDLIAGFNDLVIPVEEVADEEETRDDTCTTRKKCNTDEEGREAIVGFQEQCCCRDHYDGCGEGNSSEEDGS